MRVSLVTHAHLDHVGGVAGVTIAIGRALRQLGHEVETISFDDLPRMPAALKRHAFPLFVAFRLRKRGDVDVVDASTGTAWLLLCYRRRRFAVLTRSHGLDPLLDRQSRQDRHVLSWRYRLVNGPLISRQVNKSLILANGAMVLNRAEAAYLRDELKLSQARIHIVANGLDSELLNVVRPASRLPHEPLRVAIVGTFNSRKGSSDLVHVVNMVAHATTDVEFTFLGVGVSESVVRCGLSSELRDRARIVHHFEKDDLAGHLGGMHILLSMSRFEGASLALLEAMALGLAPIVTSAGAARELLSDDCGVVVDIGDVHAAAHAVLQLGRDDTRLLSMRRRSQLVANRYAWPSVIHGTLGAYAAAAADFSATATRRRPSQPSDRSER